MNQFLRRTVFLLFVGIAALAKLGVDSSSSVAAEQSAETLITQGIELRRGGRDADAVAKFEGAYRLEPSPRAAAQLGLCLQAVGRWADAEKYLLEAIAAKEDKWVAKNREILRESLEHLKANLARVDVYGGPEGATVTVNGVVAGTFPLKGAVLVNAGSVDIEVTKTGFRRGYRTLQIPGAQYQKVLVRLERDPAFSSPPTLPPQLAQEQKAGSSHSSQPALLNQSQVPAVVDASAENVGKPFYAKPWVWAAAGVAVLAGVLAFSLSSSGGTISPRPDDEGTYGP